MNYINRLQEETSQKDRETAALRDGLHELLCYVSSSKFSVDTTVNTSDIVNRIREIQSNANEVQ